MKWLYIILGIIALVLISWYLYRRFVKHERSILHLPLRQLGFTYIPAVPIVTDELPGTLVKLAIRREETQQAVSGLWQQYTINGVTAPAYSFLFTAAQQQAEREAYARLSRESKTPTHRIMLKTPPALQQRLQEKGQPHPPNSGQALNTFSLDAAEQYSMGWTMLGNVWRNGAEQLLPDWKLSLTDAQAATQQFWPTMAKYGVAYNLLIAQKVGEQEYKAYKASFGTQWTSRMDDLYHAQRLFVIDMRIFETTEPQTVDGITRFTPGSFVWLEQMAATKQLLPFAIYVSGYQGANAQLYSRDTATDAAWLYALQAAKVSITVYGIWLGHVYHWHIVTAAMAMTMFNNLPDTHPLYQLLAPQCQYLFAFDQVLLMIWKEIAPPSSITTAHQFITLMDTFANGRNYFDDDVPDTLKALGIDEKDFTVDTAWDAYPLAGYLTTIWTAVETYITAFVDATYADDAAVANDTRLQQWIQAAGAPDGGNVQGLPQQVNHKATLTAILTSMLYRITAHGISRNNYTGMFPALAFVGNFPPCLQQTLIPDPQSNFNTKELLQYLPNTGTIGLMLNFYYIFGYSVPYVPLLPRDGNRSDLFFAGGPGAPANKAQLQFRNTIEAFMHHWADDNKVPGIPPLAPLIHQWPQNIET